MHIGVSIHLGTALEFLLDVHVKSCGIHIACCATRSFCPWQYLQRAAQYSYFASPDDTCSRRVDSLAAASRGRPSHSAGERARRAAARRRPHRRARHTRAPPPTSSPICFGSDPMMSDRGRKTLSLWTLRPARQPHMAGPHTPLEPSPHPASRAPGQECRDGARRAWQRGAHRLAILRLGAKIHVVNNTALFHVNLTFYHQKVPRNGAYG